MGKKCSRIFREYILQRIESVTYRLLEKDVFPARYIHLYQTLTRTYLGMLEIYFSLQT